MIYLNDDAIKYALSICCERQNYKVGIITASCAKRQSVYEVLRNSVQKYNCKMRRLANNIQITFNNGSTIIVRGASEYARGYRMHLLIVDELIDDLIIEQVLRYTECLEDYDRRKRIQERKEQLEVCVPYDDEFTLFTKDEDKLITDIDEEEFMKTLKAKN